MAPEPNGAGLHQEPLADFILVRTEDVDASARLRQIDKVWAGALGVMMARDGQDTPIQVCRLPGQNRWTLVAGGHRHAGAEIEGIEYLRAEVVSAGADDRRMREVRENLYRKDLSPIDRAAFIAEAVALHKRKAGIDPARDGRTASAAVRWQKAVKTEAADATATIAGAYGFTATVAAELGFSPRTIENDLMLYRRLAPSLIERLRNARPGIASNGTQLRTLAKLDEATQRQIVDRLVTFPAVTFPEAVNYITPKPISDPETKRLSAFIGAFSRMGLTEKKGALATLRDLLPAGFDLIEGGKA